MLCSSCGAVNPSGSRFCMSCGTSLETTVGADLRTGTGAGAGVGPRAARAGRARPRRRRPEPEPEPSAGRPSGAAADLVGARRADECVPTAATRAGRPRG